jgi:RNA polymerase sigma-70 factor, ECF subfamily
MGDTQKDRSRPSVFQRSLSAAQGGSSSALGEVLEACRNYLLLIATRDVQADLRAKVSPSDLVQETCFEAQRHFARFRGASKQELMAWLRGILRNRLNKAERRFRAATKRHVGREISLNGFSSIVGPAVEATAESHFPGRQLVADEDAANLARALATLPADYQQVIRLRSFELRSFAHIGQEMDRSAEAVRSLWSRAVQRLAEEMESPDAAGP